MLKKIVKTYKYTPARVLAGIGVEYYFGVLIIGENPFPKTSISFGQGVGTFKRIVRSNIQRTL